MAYEKFKLDYGPSTFADNLAAMTHGCKVAAENKKIKISDRGTILALCAGGVAEVCIKREFEPRVTLGTILSDLSLE